MKHHLERLWQVWWARWHQTWGCWTLLKQNPLHFKLSRFLILQSWFNNVVLLLQEVNWCMEVICHGLCLPLEDHMVIRSFYNNNNEREGVMWVSLLLGTVSTSTASGCQLFCPIQSFVCQGRPINNSSAARLLTDQIISRPVLEQPNLYARKIITHFNHLFVPRKGEGKPFAN